MPRMEHIGQVLERFLKRGQLDRRVAQWQVVLAWPELVGDEVAKNSAALELRRGILWVAVPNSTWLQHILFLKPKIMSAFRDEFPTVRVADIRCIVRARRA